MRVEVTSHQSKFNVDEPALCRYAEWIMENVAALEPSFHWTELSVVLTDDRIRDLNREWFHRDSVTDVISFAYPDKAGDTGEVIVNVEQAVGEGRERDGADTELALYLAHGCHHLMGADDATPEQKDHMLTLEASWVREARERGLCGPFFP